MAAGLHGARTIAVSADGKHVYVGGVLPPQSVVALARDATTGALSFVNCIVENGLASAGCSAVGRGMIGPTSLALSADDLSVSVASSSTSDGMAAFSRDVSTGAVTQIAGTGGCVTESGFDHFGGKEEWVWQHSFPRFVEARRAVRRWIGWYNDRHPHQALGYLSPRQYRASQLQRVA